MSELFTIFYQICLPILILVGVGFVLQRKVGIDIQSLKTLTFFVILPTVIFSSVVTSDVPAADIVRVLLFVATFLLCGGLIIDLALRFAGVDDGRRRAMVLLSVNPNAGNFGFPVQELVFSSIGRGAQAQTLLSFVIIAQNLINFSVGVLYLSSHNREKGVLDHLKTILTFPPLYALVLGIIVRQISGVLDVRASEATVLMLGRLAAPLWRALTIVRGSFVPIALLTLGGQLGTMRVRTTDATVLVSVLLRMVAGPALAFLLLTIFGIHGFLAQVLFLAFGGPSAVNAMLLCLEFDASPELAARHVLYTTLVSPITVTILIFLTRSGLIERFAI